MTNTVCMYTGPSFLLLSDFTTSYAPSRPHSTIQTLYTTHFWFALSGQLYLIPIFIICTCSFCTMFCLYVYGSLFNFLPFLYCLCFTIIYFCNINVLWLLWQRNFPVCGTIKEKWFWSWFWFCNRFVKRQ